MNVFAQSQREIQGIELDGQRREVQITQTSSVLLCFGRRRPSELHAVLHLIHENLDQSPRDAGPDFFFRMSGAQLRGIYAFDPHAVLLLALEKHHSHRIAIIHIVLMNPHPRVGAVEGEKRHVDKVLLKLGQVRPFLYTSAPFHDSGHFFGVCCSGGRRKTGGGCWIRIQAFDRRLGFEVSVDVLLFAWVGVFICEVFRIRALTRCLATGRRAAPPFPTLLERRPTHERKKNGVG